MILFPVTSGLRTDAVYLKTIEPPLPGNISSHESFFSEPLSIISSKENEPLMPSYQGYNEHIIPILQQLSTKMTIGYIQNLTSFGPRVTSSEECAEAATYIYQEFQEMGLDVTYHNWTETDNLYGSNVEATLPGVNNPNDEIFIICGHYDSVYGSPGADDNAAGTSVVLSAAELMSNHYFNYTVKFVTFSGEEQGLIGSKHYARQAYENDDNIIGVLNADMMGYAATEEGERHVVVYDNDESSWLTEFSKQISKDYDKYINLEIVNGGSSGRSDHASFHWAGFNAIFYFEYEVNPNYHSSHDVLENMNPSYATNVSRLALATLLSLSELTMINAPDKPVRPTGETSGNNEEEYIYTTMTHDPDNDDVWYQWDWGEDGHSEWIGPFSSGEPCEVSHQWQKRGEYEIRVKAKDEHGEESVWSDPLVVSMPKSKMSDEHQTFWNAFPFFQKLFLLFFSRY
ncbi:MAG: M28 family peptidase [Candidatus Thermoplasmatota archaeon]|nr:M28 family peptidase [Candidatus Thermoplasmatota archaeon]